MRLLLVGGGHAHAVVLREFANGPARGATIETTLVSPSAHQFYSGMLAGLVAGRYVRAECEIDVERLALSGGARFVAGSVAGIDLAAHEAILTDGRRFDYDLLSLNAGSLPNFSAPGAQRWATPIKPLEAFLQDWEKMRAAAAARTIRIAVAGAGTAGVEIAMAMAHALGGRAHVTLYSEKAVFSGAAARRIAAALARAGVELRTSAPVTGVEEGPVLIAAGIREPFDYVVWTTGAAALPWLREAGLAVDQAGFVLVDDFLRSASHPDVFAAGDSATLRANPHPKSGVYSVRHGGVLARNLRRAAAGESLEAYVPQQRSLALIGTGEGRAIATYGPWSAEGAWLWRLKDWIDRRWIGQFALERTI